MKHYLNNEINVGGNIYYIDFGIDRKNGDNDTDYYIIDGVVNINGDTFLNNAYRTEEEAILAAQAFFIEEITDLMPNIALKDNIKSLPFINGQVTLQIIISIIRHKDNDNYKIIGELKLREIKNSEDDESYTTLDKVDSIQLGYNVYKSIEIASAEKNILKRVIERNFLNIIDLDMY